MNSSPGGHCHLPHTADLRIHAWGVSRQECLRQAILALVDGFTERAHTEPDTTIVTDIVGDDDEDTVIRVLDEIIYRIDADNLLPVDAIVTGSGPTIHLTLPAANIDRLDLVTAPKAATRHGLQMAVDEQQWSCTVIVDV